MKYMYLILMLFSVLGVFGQANYDKYAYTHRANGTMEKVKGKSFPKFTATSLDGMVFSDAMLKGKVTLLNFWFEHCGPCVAEFNDLNKLAEKLGIINNFQFISFTYDEPERARAMVEKHQLNYPVCPVSIEECLRLNFASGFPTNIVVNREGEVVFFKLGGSTIKEEVPESVLEIEQAILKCLME